MHRLLLLLLVLAAPLRAGEVQGHGYQFEKWVRDTFFDGYQGQYTQEWDIAKEANKKYGGVPVSVKFTKYGSSVDLSDALRQFSIDEKFMLVIGYWKQEGNRKRIVHLIAPVVTPEQWQKLFAPITKGDLQTLDDTVKNREMTPQQASLAAAKIKRAPPFTEAAMTMNPKIDTKGQRRLQCSLRFDLVFKYLVPGVDPAPQEKPVLFGAPAPPPFVSGPREFKKDDKKDSGPV